MLHRPSSLSFTFSKIFSSETPGPVNAKLHVEHPQEGRTKVCINGPGHMTKMAAMPIYGKNGKVIFGHRLFNEKNENIGFFRKYCGLWPESW